MQTTSWAVVTSVQDLASLQRKPTNVGGSPGSSPSTSPTRQMVPVLLLCVHSAKDNKPDVDGSIKVVNITAESHQMFKPSGRSAVPTLRRGVWQFPLRSALVTDLGLPTEEERIRRFAASGAPAASGSVPLHATIVAIDEGKVLDSLPVRLLPKDDYRCLDAAELTSWLSKFSDHVCPKDPTSPSASPSSVVASTAASGATQVNIKKMHELGKALLAKGEMTYAAKCFQRSVDVLAAVAEDQLKGGRDLDEDIVGSLALSYGWLLMSLVLHGFGEESEASAALSQSNAVAAMLSGDAHHGLNAVGVGQTPTGAAAPAPTGSSELRGEDDVTHKLSQLLHPHALMARSDALRAMVLYRMLKVAYQGVEDAPRVVSPPRWAYDPKATSEASCKAKMTAFNATTPLTDILKVHEQLTVIYFLAGDIERAITAAVKVRVLSDPSRRSTAAEDESARQMSIRMQQHFAFAVEALKALGEFIGPEQAEKFIGPFNHSL